MCHAFFYMYNGRTQPASQDSPAEFAEHGVALAFVYSPNADLLLSLANNHCFQVITLF